MKIASILKDLINTVKVVWESDMKVISDDAEKLLSDKDNKQIYLDGLRQLRELEKKGVDNPKVNIVLKNRKSLELTR